jgi:hypothetical protein
MIQEIEHNNDNLTHITDDFDKVLDDSGLRIGIANFIEVDETQGLGGVVSLLSAPRLLTTMPSTAVLTDVTCRL